MDKVLLVIPAYNDGKNIERVVDHIKNDFPDVYKRQELDLVKKAGKIKEWGVSNFDIDDMEELWQIPEGRNCLVNQVLYHTGSRRSLIHIYVLYRPSRVQKDRC